MDNQQMPYGMDPIFEKNVTETLEPLRKHIMMQRTFMGVGFGIAGLVLFFGGIVSPAFHILGILLLVLTAVFSFAMGSKKKEYDRVYKQFVVQSIIQQTLTNYQYDPIGRFDPDYLDAMRMFEREVRTCSYQGEDMLRGEYKGVRFQQADVRISYTVGSGDSRRTVWVMRGRIAEFEYGKEIHNSVVIVPKMYSHANVRGLQKVNTENVEFNRKYRVFSSDSHTVFYVLTPQLMEYIEHLNARTLTYLRFINGRVFVIQPEAGGAFEPDYSRTFDIRAEFQRTRNDMFTLLSIIDILQLDDSMEQHRNLYGAPNQMT